MKKNLAKILTVAMALSMFAPMSAMAYTEYTLNAKLVGGDNTYTWEKSDVGANEYLAPRLFSMIVADKQNMKDQFAEDGNLDALCEIANTGIAAYQGGDDTWAEWVDAYTVDGTADELLLADKTTKISDLGDDKAATITYTHGGTDYVLTVTYTSREVTSGGGGGGSSAPAETEEVPELDPNAPGVSTDTVTNTDGSTTTTTSKTDVTTNKDGSTITTTVTNVTEKNADGSTKTENTKTETVVDKNGKETTTSITETEMSNGSTGTTTQTADGTVESSAKVSSNAVKDAAKAGTPVELPLPAVSADQNPVVKIDMPTNSATDVLIPAVNTHTGVVAVLVKADGTEEIIQTSTVAAGGVVASVSGDATVKLVDNSQTFTDVAGSDWENDFVQFVAARGIMEGTGNGQFSPDTALTRGMIVQVLFALEGKPEVAMSDFDDVFDGDWYAEAAAWAQDAGVTAGVDGEGFAPNRELTREQLAVMLYGYAGKPAVQGDLSKFADANEASDWAEAALAWAAQIGLFAGNEAGELNPVGAATRAEIATIIMQFVNKVL